MFLRIGNFTQGSKEKSTNFHIFTVLLVSLNNPRILQFSIKYVRVTGEKSTCLSIFVVQLYRIKNNVVFSYNKHLMTNCSLFYCASHTH